MIQPPRDPFDEAFQRDPLEPYEDDAITMLWACVGLLIIGALYGLYVYFF